MSTYFVFCVDCFLKNLDYNTLFGHECMVTATDKCD